MIGNLDLKEAEEVWFKNDGIDIVGWVNKNDKIFDNARPIILYNGGGPGGMRTNTFVFEFQYYAKRGFSVLNCNARGNYGHGEDYSLAIKGHWGDLDVSDNIAAFKGPFKNMVIFSFLMFCRASNIKFELKPIFSSSVLLNSLSIFSVPLAACSESSVDIVVSLLVIVRVICFVALLEKIDTLLIAFIRFCLFVVSVLLLSSGITFS